MEGKMEGWKEGGREGFMDKHVTVPQSDTSCSQYAE
jgi:hypothetical protein